MCIPGVPAAPVVPYGVYGNLMSAAALQPLSAAETLAEKIRTRSARVGVIGLGYVGCPLAVEFARAGFAVTGIDVQEAKVAGINCGRSHIQDVPGRRCVT